MNHSPCDRRSTGQTFSGKNFTNTLHYGKLKTVNLQQRFNFVVLIYFRDEDGMFENSVLRTTVLYLRETKLLLYKIM